MRRRIGRRRSMRHSPPATNTRSTPGSYEIFIRSYEGLLRWKTRAFGPTTCGSGVVTLPGGVDRFADGEPAEGQSVEVLIQLAISAPVCSPMMPSSADGVISPAPCRQGLLIESAYRDRAVDTIRTAQRRLPRLGAIPRLRAASHSQETSAHPIATDRDPAGRVGSHRSSCRSGFHRDWGRR
jgi:hypothetical protein